MKENQNKNYDKKAILAVSSGTAYKEAIKLNIEACELEIAGAFPEYDIRRAFTSFPVLKKLKEKDNIHIDNVEEALKRIIGENYSKIIIQPLHVIPGDEFHEKILRNIAKYKEKFDDISSGMPLLFNMDDYLKVIEGIKHQIPELKKEEAVLFMGHGTKHPANAAYSCLQMMMEDQGLQVYIGTIDHYPDLRDIIRRLKRDSIQKVTLMPFMLTAGGHASDDMAGDGNNSWKSILESEGFLINVYLHGLGENPIIRDIFVEHTAYAVNKISDGRV